MKVTNSSAQFVEDSLFDFSMQENVEEEFDLAAKIKDVISGFTKVKEIPSGKKSKNKQAANEDEK